MKISAIKIYTHSNNGNLSKLLEKAKQPLSTQDKFETTNKNGSALNKSKIKNGCGGGCFSGGCSSCGGGCCA